MVYGLLSGEPLAVDPRDLIAGHKRVEGFWLANWVRGQNVLTGTRVGLVGATGDASGPHLHFEVRLRGAAVDPLSALP